MDDAIVWIAAGSGFVDFVVALGLLWVCSKPNVNGERRLGVRGVLVAIAASMVVFGIKAIGLLASGMVLFGLIHLVYLDLVVVVPALGLTLLAAELFSRRAESGWRMTGVVRGLAGVSLLGSGVGWYATFWEPFNLQVEAATIPLAGDRAGSASIRIAVLTDLQTRHVTEYERGAIDRLLALKPDLILIPGDIFQGSDEALGRELASLHDLLKKLDAPFGVFFAPGDVDHAPGRIERLFAGTKVKLLVNDLIEFDVHDRRVTIGGVELHFASLAAGRLIDRLEDLPGTNDVRILLGHRPDVISRLRENSRIDLVVAGHTHGGQVIVPGFGPILTLSDVPRSVAAGGLHRLDGNRIYVSRGVGCERAQAPRIRFLCPPEISILTLGGVK